MSSWWENGMLRAQAAPNRLRRRSFVYAAACYHGIAGRLLRWQQAGMLVSFAAPFLVYLRTLCPTIYPLDSAILTVGALTLGIAHANGYPTYLLIAQVFTWLPFGEPAFRVNLMSAFFGAATVALVYRLGCRLSGDRIAALIAALTLAYSYYFWSDAVVAEVYTLHTFFFAAVFELLLAWRESGNRVSLTAAAFVSGLSLGNHLSASLLVPGFLALVLGRRSKLDISTAGRAVAAAAVGLSVYAYLPLRYLAGTPFNLAGFVDNGGRFTPIDLTRPDGLWSVVSAAPFQSWMFAYAPAGLAAELGRVVVSLWGNFLAVGLVLGCWGIVQSFGRGRPGWALMLLCLPHLLFFASYAAPDKETMFLPTYVSWTLWLALGLADLRQTADRLIGRPGRVALRCLLMLLPIAALMLNFARADVSDDRRARIWSEVMLSTVEPNAYVIGWWPRLTVARYLQLAEHWRPDVQIVDRGQMTDGALQRMIDENLPSRPIYVLQPEANWERSYRLAEAAGAYRLLPKADRP